MYVITVIFYLGNLVNLVVAVVDSKTIWMMISSAMKIQPILESKNLEHPAKIVEAGENLIIKKIMKMRINRKIQEDQDKVNTEVME
jgi:hypothetical protein